MNIYEQMNQATAHNYGFDAQSNQLIEECAELIQAINKYKRGCIYGHVSQDKLIERRDNIAEEMADVMVMMQQIQHLLDIDPYFVEEIMRKKIYRQKVRSDSKAECKNKFNGMYIDRSRV